MNSSGNIIRSAPSAAARARAARALAALPSTSPMIGLSWALFVSGVPATLISQWKIQSDSTSALMIEFHRNRKHGLSDAQALRAASLAIRRNPAYQHPFYWAPFVLIGAGI